MSDVLLDTCAVIWAGNGDPIADEAVDLLNETHRNQEKTLVSPFSAWELGMLVSKSRLSLTRPVADWFSDFLDRGRLTLAELSPKILAEASFLPGEPPADPADWIIISTARALDLIVVTRDTKILNYASDGHVRAIAC